MGFRGISRFQILLFWFTVSLGSFSASSSRLTRLGYPLPDDRRHVALPYGLFKGYNCKSNDISNNIEECVPWFQALQVLPDFDHTQ